MGGNALNSIRLPKDEYFEYAREVLGMLGQILRPDSFEVIRAYRNKPSYGDLDIVYNHNAFYPEFYDVVVEHFGVTEIYKEGSCFSIKYKGFQIDLILTPTEYYDFAVDYYAWNDCGNLIGKLARRLGFKFGHKGLHHDLMDTPTKRIDRILVSRDFPLVLDFVGLDYARHNAGFDEIEDMYEYITTSPFFTPDMYQFENVSNQSRVRDRKRPTYIGFLEYIKDMPIDPDKPNKGHYLCKAFSDFEGFEDRYEKALAEYREDLAFREKLNGHVIMSLVDIQGKALGEFIAIITNKHSKQAITAMTEEDVKQMIVEEFNARISQI